VRAAGAAFRLSVRIDDGDSGHQLWTDQVDCPAATLFEVQDTVCHAIVAAAYPVLVTRALGAAVHPRPPAELTAWELAHEGMALRASREPEANAAAVRRFREALSRDPQLVLAHYGAGLAAYDAVLNQWSPKEAALDLLVSSGERCLELAPHAAEGHYLLGRHLQSRGEWARAAAPLEAAIGNNPSFALAHASLSQSLQATGRSDEALVRMQHAVRLGPRSFVVGLATLHFMREEYAPALEAAERAVVTNPGYAFARALAAASAWWLGDLDRGRAQLAALRKRHPAFRPADFAATFGARVDGVHRLTRALEALAASG
jgi:adenylate cyclase